MSINIQQQQSGFTLIEVMIVAAIIAIISAIAYPSYMNSVTRSHRHAAKACLSEYAHFMERFYMTNMRYHEDLAGQALNLPTLGCSTESGLNERYRFEVDQLSRMTYRVYASPIGVQKRSDTECGVLSLNQEGARRASGTAGSQECW